MADATHTLRLEIDAGITAQAEKVMADMRRGLQDMAGGPRGAAAGGAARQRITQQDAMAQATQRTTAATASQHQAEMRYWFRMRQLRTQATRERAQQATQATAQGQKDIEAERKQWESSLRYYHQMQRARTQAGKERGAEAKKAEADLRTEVQLRMRAAREMGADFQRRKQESFHVSQMMSRARKEMDEELRKRRLLNRAYTAGVGAIGRMYRGARNVLRVGVRVYWTFLSIMYAVRNIMRPFTQLVQGMVQGFRRIVGGAQRVVRSIVQVTGEIQTMEARMRGMFRETAAGALAWAMKEAIGKPFEWRGIAEGMIKGMAMGLKDIGGMGMMAPFIRVAEDLAAAFNKPVEQAVMAMMQGAAGTFQRLIRSFGFRPEQALEFGAVPGATGRGLAARTPEERLQNLQAIMRMIQNRVGGTAEMMRNTWKALMEDMLDMWTRFAHMLATAGFLKPMTDALAYMRDMYGYFEETGVLERWVEVFVEWSERLRPIWEWLAERIPRGVNVAITALTMLGKWFDRWYDSVGGLSGILEKAFWTIVDWAPSIIRIFRTYLDLVKHTVELFTYLIDIAGGAAQIGAAVAGKPEAVRAIGMARLGVQRVREEALPAAEEFLGGHLRELEARAVRARAAKTPGEAAEAWFGPQIVDAYRQGAGQAATTLRQGVRQGGVDAAQQIRQAMGGRAGAPTIYPGYELEQAAKKQAARVAGRGAGQEAYPGAGLEPAARRIQPTAEAVGGWASRHPGWAAGIGLAGYGALRAAGRYGGALLGRGAGWAGRQIGGGARAAWQWGAGRVGAGIAEREAGRQAAREAVEVALRRAGVTGPASPFRKVVGSPTMRGWVPRITRFGPRGGAALGSALGAITAPLTIRAISQEHQRLIGGGKTRYERILQMGRGGVGPEAMEALRAMPPSAIPQELRVIIGFKDEAKEYLDVEIEQRSRPADTNPARRQQLGGAY